MSRVAVFLVILSMVRAPSLAADEGSDQRYADNAYYVRKFKNLQGPPKIAQDCICGLLSIHCCKDTKRTIAKVSWIFCLSFFVNSCCCIIVKLSSTTRNTKFISPFYSPVYYSSIGFHLYRKKAKKQKERNSLKSSVKFLQRIVRQSYDYIL